MTGLNGRSKDDDNNLGLVWTRGIGSFPSKTEMFMPCSEPFLIENCIACADTYAFAQALCPFESHEVPNLNG